MNKKILASFGFIIASLASLVSADGAGTNFFNPLDVINSFVTQAGPFISQAFRMIVYFLQFLQIMFLNIIFIMVCLLFFAIIIACMWVPIKLYPYFVQAKALYYKFFEGFTRSK
jgi:hypothetical protein